MIEVDIDKDVYLECYQHILDSTIQVDIDFIWGTRDSGKSKFIAQKLTEECMALDYFRCLLIKETHESIKDAQWQTIKDVAEEWAVDALFKFKTSPLVIECMNGNRFLSRGMNEPGRIKSISNPSHAWVEEGNQISKDGFITLLTSLRSDHGPVKLYFSFNPEADTTDFKDFWLFEMFFKDYYPTQLNFVGKYTMEVEIKPGVTITVQFTYRSTHTTYLQNPYCTPQRIAFYESLRKYDPYKYNIFGKGLWTNKVVDGLFAWAYKREKHVGRCSWNPKFHTYLSFDFNKNPICCTVFQLPERKKVNIIESIKLPNSNIYALCDYIMVKYPHAVFMVTGDATGQNSSALVKDDLNYYMIIKQKLNIKWTQIVVPTINPTIEENQVLVNVILNDFDVTVDEVNGKGVIFDFENVALLPTGKIDKSDRDDPKKQADALDTVRYFFNTFLRWYLKELGLG